jgi:hypothetical protein
MDDLPVPFGPTIKFKPGEGEIVTFSNTMKSFSFIAKIAPSEKFLK